MVTTPINSTYNPVTKLVNTRALDAVLVLSELMIPRCGAFLGGYSWEALGSRPGWLPFNVGGFCPWCTGENSPGLGITLKSNVRRIAQSCTRIQMEPTT